MLHDGFPDDWNRRHVGLDLDKIGFEGDFDRIGGVVDPDGNGPHRTVLKGKQEDSSKMTSTTRSSSRCLAGGG